MGVFNYNIGIKLVDDNRVRSVIVTKYDVWEREKIGWFSNKKCYELERRESESEKRIYEEGRIKERLGQVLLLGLFSFSFYCRRIYEYRNGLEIGCRGYDNKGNIIYGKKSEYYSNGKLKQTEEFVTLQHKSVNHTETYVRDLRGNQIEQTNISEGYEINESGIKKSRKRTWIQKFNWIYGDNISREIWEAESIEGNDRRCHRGEERYDRNGRKVMEIEYGEKGNVEHTWEYKYDNQGRNYKWFADGYCKDEWRYNEHGDVVWFKYLPNLFHEPLDWERERINKYEEKVETHEYLYDDKGNWIEDKVFLDGKYRYLTTREIEYLY